MNSPDLHAENLATPTDRPSWGLHPAQRAVWLDLQWAADPLSYQLTGSCWIDGPLSEAMLQQSLTLLAARHDALRLRIEAQRPRQWLSDEPLAPLGVHQAMNDAEALNQRAALLTQVLRLGGAPLFAFDLIRVSTTRALLLWRFHHLISDGMSMDLVLQRWLQTCQVLSEDTPQDLPAGSNYTEHLPALQTEPADDAALAPHLQYWRERLSHRSAQPLFTAPTVPQAQAHAQVWALEGPGYQSFVQACQAQKVTVQQALQGLYAIALASRHDRWDVTVGLALHGREFAHKQVIGMFSKALPIRVRLDPLSTLKRSVMQVAEQMSADFRHQAVPTDALARAVAHGHEPKPLYEAALTLRQVPASPSTVRIGALTLQTLPTPHVEIGALGWHVMEHLGSHLSMALCHRADLLDATEVAALAAHLQGLMQAFAAPQNTWLFELPALTPTEQALLQPPIGHGPAKRLDHEIVARCHSQPEAVALVEGAHRWTYAELLQLSAERAGRLRHWLDQQAEVNPEPVVALCQARSADTVIWMLAILRAQAVLLPIDPHLPSARQHFMVRDARAVLSIGQGDSPSDWPGPWWPSDAPPEAANADLTATRLASAGAHHLAYLIYTSGSTGQPKPVAVPHAAVCNLVAARALYYAVGPGDRVLATNAVGFDVSISQLLMPLAQGACIVMAPPLRGLAPERFWRLVSEHDITHLNATPSVMEAMLDHPAQSTPRSLIVGGEALTGALAQRLMRALPHTRTLNVYGPTETCIDATQWALNDHPERLRRGGSGQAMPIGRGLLHYQVMVLDSQWRLAAPGVEGEVFVGGAGLARGYLGQPQLTAERFVPNPFGPPGSRMYRTGDRALWRADGEIEFLGRRDDQVKVRGFRIQTGEIAAALCSLLGVTQAVVLARPLVEGGEPALVAYWQGQGWSPSSLRDALAQHLPEYMLPLAYVCLGTLPLTVNQKLDWRALPLPGLQDRVQGPAREAPQGELEQTLATLWQDLLGLEDIGRHDSFFALGGHSLGLVRLAEQLRQRGWAVDMAALFGRPTIAALSQQLRPLVEGEAVAPLLPLSESPWAELVAQAPGGADNVEALLPLTAMQHGLLFHHLLQPQDDGYQERIHLRFATRSDALAMVEALRQLIRRHQALRAAMRWEGLPEPVQLVLREVELPVGRWDPASPSLPRLDLSQAPLLAVALQDGEAHQPCELVLSCHHLIMDHESMALLVTETVALHLGQALPQPGLLSEWMARQHQQRHSPEDYFSQALQGVTQGTVPYGLTSLERQPAGRRLRHTLNPALCMALRQWAQKQAVSPAAVFHLAWLRCLAHVCGQTDVITGTVLLGRSHVTAPHTMGMFINTLPLRVALGNLSPRAALQAVHQALAGLMAHEQASLSQAMAAAGLPPQEPLFTSLMNYRHSASASSSLADHWPGLEVLEVSESATFVVDVAVDDHGDAFTLSLEVDGRLDPAPLCALLQEALTQLCQHQSAEQPLLSWPLRADLLAPPAVLPSLAPATPHGAALFRAAAQRHAQAVALRDERRQMSYAEVAQEVHRRARALLQALGGKPARPDPVVGLALERSIEVVLWLLALHEAGIAALPLDVSHPINRLNAMLQDSAALFVISDQATRDWVVPAWHELPPSAADAAPARPLPQDVAYIIYTSGSTGQPKGVAVPHTALAHLSASRQVNDPLHPGDVVLATSSIGFDIAMGQLLLPLYQGATVVVSPPLRELDAAHLSALLNRHGVTHVDGVPSFYELLLQGSAPRSLVSATLGGERITPQLVRRLRAAWPAVKLLNVYGPTETTIDGTAWVLPPHTELAADARQVPIGQAMPFYRAYVLDAHWQPVPPGAPGELWLGGDCVARGYVRQAGLTAQRFVPDPWGLPGSRMYRTGDRVCLQPDGHIVFLGRQDAQVKLRGHRIELAEIEQRLLSHAAVRRVVLRVQPVGTQGSPHLVAYLEGQACPVAELRQHCLHTLPEYMCPSAWVWLEALPCTPNGKVDMAALPAPDMNAQRDASQARTPPRTELEGQLLTLWQQVLEHSDIGVEDDFFELGGHSLALLRLHASMAQHLGRSLPLRLLFEYATIERQAMALSDTALSGPGANSLLPLRPAQGTGNEPPLFAIYPYGGTSFCYAELARLLPAGPALWGLQAQGLEAGETPLRDLPAMAALALRQIRALQPQGPLRLLGYSMGGLIAVEMARQEQADGRSVALLALLDSPLPGLPNDARAGQGDAAVMADVVQGLLPHLPASALPRTPEELQRHLAASLPPGTALSGDDVQRILDVASGMLEAARAYQPPHPPLPTGTWLQVRTDDGLQAPVDWQPWLQRELPTLTLPVRHEALLSGEAARTLADWLTPWISTQNGEPHA